MRRASREPGRYLTCLATLALAACSNDPATKNADASNAHDVADAVLDIEPDLPGDVASDVGLGPLASLPADWPQSCSSTPIGDGPIGPRFELTLRAPTDATSFVLVPFVRDGVLLPVSLTTPSTSLSLRDDYIHHNGRLRQLALGSGTGVGRAGEIAFDWPIGVPFAPKWQALVQPGGEYTLVVETNLANETCAYLAPGSPGSSVGLNVWLVGSAILDANAASSDADLADVLTKAEFLLGKAGLELSDTRFLDVPAQVAETLAILRDEDDLAELTAWGEAASAEDEALRVDVFLVEDLWFGLLGSSPSLPGAPGMHGNIRNGLAFDVSDLGDDNDRIAYTLAHEIAHYLGLRHTTEVAHGEGTDNARELAMQMGTADPIDDTPECLNIRIFDQQCPDATNLMFPTAPPRMREFDAELSAGQAAVLRASPLVR